MHDLVTEAVDLSEELTRMRRAFHRVPELGLQLPRTQELVLRELDGLPLEITLGEDLTSVVAVLRGGTASSGDSSDARSRSRASTGHRDVVESSRPAVLLRSDMDALPVEEDLHSPFRSEIAGQMHACGHDVHMAMCIGAARLLAERRERLAGDVVFMFQPGEEGYDGASHMLREGVLDASGTRVRAAYALHTFSSSIPHGQFTTRPGAFMSASEDLKVVVRGRGGHGSTPHRANDPVVAMAEMVMALQTMVTRKFDIFDPVVVTVGSLHAGHQRNTISESAFFDATVRSFSAVARERVRDLIPTLIEGIAAAHGVQAACTWEGGYPLLSNNTTDVDFVENLIGDMFGASSYRTLERPFAASEDFARVLNEVPGAMIAYSAVPVGIDAQAAAFNHSPRAYFDESIMPSGTALLAQLATSRLELETQSGDNPLHDHATDGHASGSRAVSDVLVGGGAA